MATLTGHISPSNVLSGLSVEGFNGDDIRDIAVITVNGNNNVVAVYLGK